MPGGYASASQLLELNLISARDLAHVSRSMKPFAVAWINPARKLATRPDSAGQSNPTWNEKFVFRVGRDFLADESSAVAVEIHAKTRRGDVVLLGAVGVPVASLFSPPQTTPFKSKMRFLSLQIRRPSGRPQGVLDVGVALLDGARRSMPLSDLSSHLIEFAADADSDVANKNIGNPKAAKASKLLRRSKSERSISECYLLKAESEMFTSSSAVSESAVNYGKGRGSLCSDIGPSPSVVAAAIARGLYQTPGRKKAAAESSILEDWVEEDDSVEGLKTKIERWRSEIHPLYQKNLSNNAAAAATANGGGRSMYRKNEPPQTPAPGKRELRRGGSGLFSCFGTAYGCEFSITCGGGNSGRRKRSSGGGEDGEAPLSLSELDYDDHYV